MKKMTIKLDAVKWEDGPSLGELLKKAEEVLNPGLCVSTSRAWIARNAVRALCEAIIHQGEITAPLKVKIVGARASWINGRN